MAAAEQYEISFRLLWYTAQRSLHVQAKQRTSNGRQRTAQWTQRVSAPTYKSRGQNVSPRNTSGAWSRQNLRWPSQQSCAKHRRTHNAPNRMQPVPKAAAAEKPQQHHRLTSCTTRCSEIWRLTSMWTLRPELLKWFMVSIFDRIKVLIELLIAHLRANAVGLCQQRSNQ